MADAIEWRLDTLAEIDFTQLTKARPAHKTLIITLRSQAQGGHGTRSLAEQTALLKKACDHLQPQHLDVTCELAETMWHWTSIHHPHIRLLLSQHDHTQTPINLLTVLQALRSYPHHSIKLATTASCDLDALRMLALCYQEKAFTGICMGQHGISTRLLSPMVGNQWHYHSATHTAVAPGQYAIQHAQRHINHHTQLYGLLGDPIAKSIGDQFHHAYFIKHHIHAVYVKWCISKQQLPLAMAALNTLPTHGLSITTPLKHQCLRHADHVAPCVQRIRACNTLVRSETKWWAYNTDGLAAIALLQPWVQNRQQSMCSCHILGAGATAISIASSCLQQGWSVFLYARRAPTMPLRSLSIQPLQSCKHLPDNAMVINTIPSQTTNFPTYLGQYLKKSMLFLDCVYQPTASPLSNIASQLGCHTIHGKQLFIQQALLQQQHWQHNDLQLNDS